MRLLNSFSTDWLTWALQFLLLIFQPLISVSASMTRLPFVLSIWRKATK